eukprot:SAG22_NODE_14440_length_374_cov_1.320000_1_plen_25_part_10
MARRLLPAALLLLVLAALSRQAAGA